MKLVLEFGAVVVDTDARARVARKPRIPECGRDCIQHLVGDLNNLKKIENRIKSRRTDSEIDRQTDR